MLQTEGLTIASAGDGRARTAGAVWSRLATGIAALTVLGSISGAAAAQVRVVASINDLASIAAEVGGDRVEVLSIARPEADVHRVEVLPSYMVRVSRADLYLRVGLGLDAWADPIIDGSRNRKIAVVDCSRGISPLDRPAGKVDASMGDVHPEGNPHYWLDPRNGAIVAGTIAEALGRADPQHAGEFQARAEEFGRKSEVLLEESRARLAPLPSRSLLTYHSSWVYLAHAFDLQIVGTVEPVPGIPPTGRHLQELVEIVQARQVPVLLEEPYFSPEAGRFLSRETGIRVVRISASCDRPEAGSWAEHLRSIVEAIAGTAR